MEKTQFRQIMEDRYNELLDQEAELMDALYELDLEEVDPTNEVVIQQIKEAKRIAGEELDAWWQHNKLEYMDLRKILNGC